MQWCCLNGLKKFLQFKIYFPTNKNETKYVYQRLKYYMYMYLHVNMSAFLMIFTSLESIVAVKLCTTLLLDLFVIATILFYKLSFNEYCFPPT